MELLHELIRELPQLASGGMLDYSGGSIGVRSENGLYVSPDGAGTERGWNLSEDDFVLFPGGGEASMAQAGRRPHRMNKLHRTALGQFTKWNITMEVVLPGLLAFAYAGNDLILSPWHSGLFKSSRGLQVQVWDLLDSSISKPEEKAVELIRDSFSQTEFGAVLISGAGLFAGADSIGRLHSRVMLLEKAANACSWQLTR